MTRPRVLHVVVAGELGGAERMLCDLATRPDESGAEHTIALLTPNAKLVSMFESAGLSVRDRGRVSENPAAFLWRSLGPSDVSWIARVGQDERANIVHLHTFASHVVGTRAAERLGLPVVRTEHSTRVYDDATCWPFSRWSLRRASRVVFVSEHLRRVGLAKGASDIVRSSVIRNGVDVNRFAPVAHPLPPEKPFVFVLVGRLERRKGVDRAVDALASVDNARLEIVGDGQAHRSLKRLVLQRRLRDRAHFHGALADPRPVIAGAHAALCSSREEGLGIANLEAMAMAKPVVASPVGGVPEMVRDGQTGLLASDMSVPALAARMREVVANPSKAVELGLAARAFVVESCSLGTMCHAYAALYREILET